MPLAKAVITKKPDSAEGIGQPDQICSDQAPIVIKKKHRK